MEIIILAENYVHVKLFLNYTRTIFGHAVN